MKTLLALAFSLVLAGNLAAKDPETKVGKADGATHVDAKAAATLVAETDEAKKVTVLDIRTPVEFTEGHIDGAQNIDFLDQGFSDAIAKLDRDKPYLVHCRSGGRSGKSLAIFKKLGFKNLYHLDGGLAGWQTAGNPVKKEAAPPKEEKSDGKDAPGKPEE